SCAGPAPGASVAGDSDPGDQDPGCGEPDGPVVDCMENPLVCAHVGAPRARRAPGRNLRLPTDAARRPATPCTIARGHVPAGGLGRPCPRRGTAAAGPVHVVQVLPEETPPGPSEKRTLC